MLVVAQLCPTLCDPMDGSLPGSSVCGVLQARILEWVLPFPFPGGLPNPGIKPKSPNWQADSFSFVVGVKVVFMIRPFYTTMLGLKLSVKNDSELHLWGPGAHCYFLKHQYMLLKERS